jgi:hypothetical protein
LVLISKLRMAASSSLSAADPPCIDVPPVMLTFAFDGAGEVFRDVPRDVGALFVLRSEIREPAAEGGGFEMVAGTTSAFGGETEALLAVGAPEETGRFDI